MGITVRKEEIAIMKYIGAKDFVVRSPFVIEGLIMGLFGAVIPLALLYVLYGKAVGFILERFSILNNIITFLPVDSVYRYLLPIGFSDGSGNRICRKFLYSPQALESLIKAEKRKGTL